MKKLLAAICAVALLMTGCGGDSVDDKPAPKIGTLAKLNAASEQSNLNFYDDFNAMQMALASKNLDAIQTYGSVAKYMTANNADFVIDEDQTIQLVDDFCCALRDEDIDLKNACDAAIDAMKADGTLDALIDKYITNAAAVPEAVAMNHFDGAETLTVGVTGDLPPLDLVLADGTPAGFNTAVLAELGKRLGKNIALVQVSSSARAAALVSGQVDIIFWVVVPADDSGRPKDLDTPAGVAVTAPYYQDVVVNVNLAGLAAAF